MATAQDIVNIGSSQVGQYGRPNKFTTWYGFSDEWCDMFVSWVFNQAGALKGIGGKFALTTAHARWFQSQGRWGTTPQVGACVFFDWNGGHAISGIDHVGIVIEGGSGGTIKTVEGNTGGNQVAIRTRSVGNVVGYGYPVLDGSPIPVNPAGFNASPAGLTDPFGIFSKLNEIAKTVLNPKWWERIGIVALGLLIIAFAIVIYKRRQIEGAVKTGAEVAAFV